MLSRNVPISMVVLCTRLHLIATFWKKINVEGIGLFLACETSVLFLCFYSLWNHCVSDLYSIKAERIIRQVWNCLLSLFWCAATQIIDSLPGIPTHQCSQFRFLPECLWVLLPAAAAWKLPGGRRLWSHQVDVCSLSVEEPSPGTLTACCSSSEKSCFMYFVQLSHSQW